MTSLRALQKGLQISRRFKLHFSESQNRFMGTGPYRVYPRPDHTFATDALMTFAWSWLWYNLFTNYDKAYVAPTQAKVYRYCPPLTNFFFRLPAYKGHYWYPDPSKWTDEELGIPPMSEEDSTD